MTFIFGMQERKYRVKQGTKQVRGVKKQKQKPAAKSPETDFSDMIRTQTEYIFGSFTDNGLNRLKFKVKSLAVEILFAIFEV